MTFESFASASKRFFLMTAVCVLITANLCSSVLGEEFKWQGSIPPSLQDPTLWDQLLLELKKENLPFTTLAAAHRVLLYFPDLSAKESAYRAIIDLIDEGYPYSTDYLFVSGDIEPKGDLELGSSYFLLKGIINQNKGLTRWADYFFGKLDRENDPKYLFFLAVQAYSKKDLDLAEATLRKILSKDLPERLSLFSKKTARTLARVLFEREKYAESFSIYQDFLLRSQPLTPDDWLEAAWNLYYLGRGSEALGLLTNLEALSARPFASLERFVIRSLIHRENCASEAMAALIVEFESQYGAIIEGIKRGSPLSKFQDLESLHSIENLHYEQLRVSLRDLSAERDKMTHIPVRLAAVAKWLVSSEERLLKSRLALYRDQTLERNAENLVMLSENLKFLKFDVEREKFNPDTVFVDEPLSKSSVNDLEGNLFEIRWPQIGDYWRDERLHYIARTGNRCTPQ